MTAAAPHFRLLLHGQDGSIPYLKPELMRLIFCPPSGGGKDTTSNDGDDNDDLQQSWKWQPLDHLIVGVAVKDTCVTAVYRDVKPSSGDNKKRKNEQNGGSVGDNKSAKRVKSEQSSNNDAPSSNTQKSETTHTTTDMTSINKEGIDNKISTKQQPLKSSNDTTKKPAGYTFLTPSQSAQICKEINSHINTDGTLSSLSTNYMQTYLRIPQYISTLIVPTFTLDSPDNNNSASDVKSSIQDVNKTKHVPKQSSDNNQSKPKQQQKAKDAIPNSTKDSMPVDTPHGWQKIKPEQYVDAVTSLTNIIPSSTTAATASNDKKTAKSLCEGAVGLFDHINTSRDQANCMFAQFMKDNGGDDNVLTPQAHKSIEGMVVKGKWETMVQKVVQRTNDWSIRTTNYNPSPPSTQTMPFWLPIHMAASHLPLKYMFSCPRSNPSQEETQTLLSKGNNHISIIGWDSISYNREYRRQALRQLMTTLQSSPTSTTPPRRKEYLILAVNDIQSIVDAAREGVSIIGTDMVRLWSRDGMALCLDMSLDNGEKNDIETTASGMIDLSDEKYARDSSSLLPRCQCVSCRPRQINTRSNHLNTKCTNNQTKKSVPSFTRAYIHHLIKANEMLAETLLFVHNLHQMLLLFRQLSQAASLDDEKDGDEKRNLGALCQKIEEQL